MLKRILMTGASSGFGCLNAETLAKAGNYVVGGFRTMYGKKGQVAEEFQKNNIQVLQLDVTDQNSVDLALKRLLEISMGELDVVINNAGMASAGISESFTPEQGRDLFEVDVFGVQRVIRAPLPVLRAKRSGLIINLVSILVPTTIPLSVPYRPSNHARSQ